MPHCNSHLPLTGVIHQRPSIMYRHDSNKAPVTYQDVSAYFSEEEWKLLHDWQKELYSKVMNEVHQALILLGPLIATTVSTLRSKEMKDGCAVDHEDADTRRSTGGDGDTNSVVSFWIDQEKTTTLKANPETDIRDQKHCTFDVDKDLKTDQEFVLSLMEHHNVDDGGSGNSFNSGQVDMTPIVKFQIKEEVETYYLENGDSDTMNIVNSSRDGGTVNAPGNYGESVKCCEWTLPNASSGRNASLSEKQIQAGSEMWSDYYQGLGEVKTAQCESTFINPSESNLDEETPKQSTQRYNTCTVNLVKANLLSFCVQQKSAPETFPTYKQSFSQNTESLRHRDDRPFKCSECEKSFRQKAHLIRHQATHRGDRPFHCTECHQRFSRNEYLVIHQRKHTGEIPYKCTVCMKGFRQKRSLVSHQAVHRGMLTQSEVSYKNNKLPV